MKFTLSDLYLIVSRLSSTRQMSVRRLIKIAYLLDWHMAFKVNRESSNAWIIGVCGPTDTTIESLVEQGSQYFDVFDADNHCGGMKRVVRCKDIADDHINVDVELASAINRVFAILHDIRWGDLVKIVTSTYPVMRASPGMQLELKVSAKEYQEILKRRVRG